MGSTLLDARHMRPPPVSAVGTARCISYTLPCVRRAVRRCVEALPDMQECFHEASSVLLKPNLLSSRRGPEAHVNTHPAVVQALAELLTGEFGCEVAVGDSCGSLSEGSTARAIVNSRMDEAAWAAGASIYNVDTQPRHVVSFEGGRLFREIPLPSNLDQFDLIVSVGKLKTHNLTCMTGAVKNLYGLIPGAGKKQGHLLAPRVADFATLLCDLYALIRPGAAFIDGVVGMEGRGPANGSLRHVEMLAASCDAVALDSFCAQVMGLDPLSVPMLAECRRRELGTVAPAEMAVRGESAADFAPGDFAKPPAYANALMLRLMPRWVFRGLFGAMTTRRAAIDQARCARCGECARNCPSQAISMNEASGQYHVEPAKCIACYCCSEVCPHDAVLVRGTWLGEALRAPLRRLRRR